MDAAPEFLYRVPGRVGGQRPGAHDGSALGSGQAFATHARLFDRPDPRRLDLRASLRSTSAAGRLDWLVRVQRQRSAVAVHAVVDLSASMHFGSARSKLQHAADVVEALGHSTFRVGDPLGLIGFDASTDAALHVPARHGRGVGAALVQHLRAVPRPAPRKVGGPASALQDALALLAGRSVLVFLVSDFLFPLAPLEAALASMARAWLVPIVVSDRAEREPPSANAWLDVEDAESGARRSIWIDERLRRAWRARVEAHRCELDALFAAHGLRPFRLHDRFDAEAMSRYFLEGDA